MFLVHLLFFYVSNSEFYDSGALMMEEEGVVMGGLLVGLNVIDANLCIKGEDLDSQVSTQNECLDFFFCLKKLIFLSFPLRWESSTSPSTWRTRRAATLQNSKLVMLRELLLLWF